MPANLVRIPQIEHLLHLLLWKLTKKSPFFKFIQVFWTIQADYYLAANLPKSDSQIVSVIFHALSP